MTNFIPVARLEDLLPGSRLHYSFEEDNVIVLNVDGELFCIADLCTHDGGPLEAAELHEFQIECPRHGACFDVRSGKVTRLPATDPIPTYQVKIEDGVIYVEEPEMW